MGQRNCETEITPVALPPEEAFEESASSQVNENKKEMTLEKSHLGKEEEKRINETKNDSANSDSGSMSPDEEREVSDFRFFIRRSFFCKNRET